MSSFGTSTDQFSRTLTANIRNRRGSKVAINLPLYIDTKTPRPFVDPTIPWQRSIYSEDPGMFIIITPQNPWWRFRYWLEAKNGAALLDHIYLDAMGFGMGCCCLQLTFQSCNVGEARRMYDALIPLGPIMVSNADQCQDIFMLTEWLVGIVGCESHMAWVPGWYWLSLECDCWQCRRSHFGRTGINGDILICKWVFYTLTVLVALERKSFQDSEIPLR